MEEKKNEIVNETVSEAVNETINKTAVEIMKKPRRVRNVLMVVLAIVFAAIFSAGTVGVVAVDFTGASTQDVLNKTPYFSLSTTANRMMNDATNRLVQEMNQEAYWVDGAYDSEQTIDVSHLSAGILYGSKNLALTYSMADLVAMYEAGIDTQLYELLETYESIDKNYPEIIALLEQYYGACFFYVDEVGNLYASDADADTIRAAMEFNPNGMTQVDVNGEETWILLYLVDQKGIHELDAFPKGFQSAQEVSWSEFSGRYILDTTVLSEREKSEFSYEDYGYGFQYFYQYGKELETLLPLSGEPIYVYALKNPAKVSIRDSYKQLAAAIRSVGSAVNSEAYLQESYTDFSEIPLSYYWVRNVETGVVWTNHSQWEHLAKENIQDEILESQITSEKAYPVYYFGNIQCEDGVETFSSITASGNPPGEGFWGYVLDRYEDVEIEAIVAMNPAINDPAVFSVVDPSIYLSYNAYELHREYALWYYGGIVVGGIGFIVFFIAAIVMAGKRDKTRVRYAGAFVRNIPIELLLLLDAVVTSISVAMVVLIVNSEMNNQFSSSPYQMLMMFFCILGMAVLFVWEILVLVLKGKSRNMGTHSLVKVACKKATKGIGKSARGMKRRIKTAYANRKVTGKLLLWSALFCGVNLVFVGLAAATYTPGIFIFILIVIWIATICLLMKKCIQKQRLKDGIREIATGNLEYQIDMSQLSGDELDMAKDLNNLKDGMETALERMMKSERMKTDLITNVSHDLKTPLTSIINYVDILKKEDIPDEKIRGYIQILEQKSLRLKNLTEDLMEAAKISSGNITLEIQNINLKQLIHQTNAEFEEKFARRNLSLVCTLPDSDVFIKADSRRMWRVIENLYNNAAKYAQPYSRVYVDGRLESGKAILIIKNVSEAPLNISADELMERFVRGDVARNTEGSGLGLEIARNLTVMQKGSFDIQLDGDLFKVVLTFDAV